ncbi:hypothetical protein Leryth_019016 [Lithospermum erythrorhizon]|nr:hypothetical protein Leryth_019016 [Lithospermum erythrorhizon]
MKSLRDGLKHFAYAIKSGLTTNVFNSNQLIHLYAKRRLIREAHKLFDEMPNRNVFTWNAIINGYVKARDLMQAQLLFAASPCKDSVTYNSMLSGYIDTQGYESDAVELFRQLQSQNHDARIDEFSLTLMLNLASKLGALIYGNQLHCYMVKTANNLSHFAVSSLIHMYSKCGCLLEAWKVFDGCPNGIYDLVSKNAMMGACIKGGELEMASELFWSRPELHDHVSWNTMISGYAQNGYEEEAIKLFKLMADEGYKWNEHSFASVLTACSSLKSRELGKQIHARALREGIITNPFISNGLVNVYSKCGDMKYAELVNATLGGENIFAAVSMIVGYSAVGNMLKAQQLFDSLAEKNLIVLTAIISGFLKSRQCKNVFRLFRDLIQTNAVVPDTLILAGLLGACALGALIDPGKQIHAYLLRMGYMMDEKIISTKVDMYAKCGNINYAQRIFQKISQKDTVLYNIMIGGYAHHGFIYEAFQLFHEMKGKGVQPDAITFIALLSVCRHRGLVEMGESYFLSMTEEYEIQPETDHFACMIDLYGRANQLDKAIAFMGKLPVEEDAVILGTFLNACKSNKNVELAGAVEEKLLQIEGRNGARYVQFASIYALEEKWDEMGRIMKQMREKEVKKTTGCSWIHIGERVHTFTSSDRSHSEIDAIYFLISCLIQELDAIRLTEERILEESQC